LKYFQEQVVSGWIFMCFTPVKLNTSGLTEFIGRYFYKRQILELLGQFLKLCRKAHVFSCLYGLRLVMC